MKEMENGSLTSNSKSFGGRNKVIQKVQNPKQNETLSYEKISVNHPQKQSNSKEEFKNSLRQDSLQYEILYRNTQKYLKQQQLQEVSNTNYNIVENMFTNDFLNNNIDEANESKLMLKSLQEFYKFDKDIQNIEDQFQSCIYKSDFQKLLNLVSKLTEEVKSNVNNHISETHRKELTDQISKIKLNINEKLQEIENQKQEERNLNKKLFSQSPSSSNNINNDYFNNNVSNLQYQEFENNQNKERNLQKAGKFICQVCLVNQSTHILIPCGHFMFCQDCVEKLETNKNKACPICRKYYTNSYKVYMN